jgi:NADPH2:quinone reductase
MKAAVIVAGDKGPTLAIRDVPEPKAGPFDLLIAVKAIALNRADLARGGAAGPNGELPIGGMEVAGEVVGLGEKATGFAIGDRVMSMTRNAYAEKAVADCRVALKVPAHMSWAQAAATPTALLTVHDALVTNGRFKAGDAVLIQGVAAGVGIAAVQMAKALGASVVMGTSRNEDKLTRLRDLGLDVGIVSGRDDVAALCKKATGGQGVQVILDNIGAGVTAQNLESAAIMGRIVSIGRLGGKVDEIDLDKVALKRLSLIGVTFRTRNDAEKAAITRAAAADLGAALEAGKLDPLLDRSFPLDEALAAQDYMKSNAHLGKVVLTV